MRGFSRLYWAALPLPTSTRTPQGSRLGGVCHGAGQGLHSCLLVKCTSHHMITGLSYSRAYTNLASSEFALQLHSGELGHQGVVRMLHGALTSP